MFATRGYLLEVSSARIPTLRTLRELVDILACCQFTEFHIDGPALPVEDLVALDAYCELQGLRLVTDGKVPAEHVPGRVALLRDRWVCADTFAARSLAGRVEHLREHLEAAERDGRLGGATGFLLVDEDDDCHWHPLAASLPGIILGGSFAVSGAKAARMDLERELDRVMDAPLGGTLLRLGTLYLRGGAVRENGSELFNILSSPIGYSRHPGLTDPILEEIGAVARGCRIAAERWTDRNDWAKEIVWMADLVDAACHRRDESRLRALRDEHGRIWRLRFRDEGRIESLARLPRF